MTTYSRPGVFINELPLAAGPVNGTAAATSAGAVIAAFPQGPEAVTKVTSWYDFTKRFGGYNKKYPATFGVASFFKNGGTELYVRRILSANATTASVTVPINHSGAGNLLKIAAKNRGLDGNNIRLKFSKSGLVKTSGYWDLSVYLEGETSSTADDILVEQFNGLVFDDADSSDYIATVLDFNSKYIKVDSTVNVNTTDTYGPSLALLPLTGATTPENALTYAEYTGDATQYESGDTPDYTACTLFREFEVIDQPLVFFLPDVISQLSTWSAAVPVYRVLIDWAATNLHFVIAEFAKDTAVNAAVSAAADLTVANPGIPNRNSRVAAYYPHLYITDPLGHSGNAVRKIGPAGAVAGQYLATDAKIGPFKAAAGINAQLSDAIAIEKAFTPAELDALNSGVTTDGTAKAAVNAIRNLPGAGVVIMGGRTLQQDGTANRYVNMRRSLIYVEKRLKDLASFALFENNSEQLWSRINTTLGVFLNEYRNQGGLRGTTVDEAFFIKCDEENNTPATIAAGEVHIEVGVALEYPAEFVVINLSQKTAN